MTLRDCLVRHGIVDSPRVCSLPVAVQLFFRNLLHVCDGAGRFAADADRLRTVLYGRVLSRVARGDVARWLTQCHLADLITLYTRDGRGYGRVLNYGQRDRKRRIIYPGEEEEGLFATAPPGAGGPNEPWAEEGAEGRLKPPELKRKESPHSPPPEAGGGDASLGERKTPASAAPVRFRRAVRLETLHDEKERIESELQEILRPGGCAYNVTPTGAKARRFEALKAAHAELEKRIESRRQALADERGD